MRDKWMTVYHFTSDSHQAASPDLPSHPRLLRDCARWKSRIRAAVARSPADSGGRCCRPQPALRLALPSRLSGLRQTADSTARSLRPARGLARTPLLHGRQPPAAAAAPRARSRGQLRRRCGSPLQHCMRSSLAAGSDSQSRACSARDWGSELPLQCVVVCAGRVRTEVFESQAAKVTHLRLFAWRPLF